MSHRRLLFSILIITSIVALTSGQRRKSSSKSQNHSQEDLSCDSKNNEKIDIQVAKIMVIGENGRKYPEDRKQLKSFCDETSQILTTIDRYKNKCFKGTLKQFSSLYIYSSRTAIKRFCTKGNKHVDPLLNAAKCMNKHMKKMSTCMTRMIDNFVGIKYATNENKIPHICCEYVHLVQCFAKEMGTTECKSEVDTMLAFYRQLMGNFVDTTCGDYNEDTDRCNKLGKPPKKHEKERSPKSILYPLHDIINSLPQ